MIRTAVVAAGLLASSTFAADLHVNLAMGPYTSIQTAISSASAGDRVLIQDVGAATVYFEDIDFLGKDIIVMADPANVNPITLHGSGTNSVVTMNSGEPTTARLEGIRITNGAAVQGGGINIENSGATITRVVVERCIGDFGAGIAVVSGRAFLHDVQLIANNEPSMGHYGVAGGGLYADRSTVSWKLGGTHDNRARMGGGVFARRSRLEVSNAYFIYNDADNGGGAYLAPSKYVYRFTECDFTANNASPITGTMTIGGGAMIAGADVEFTRTHFKANWSYAGPGGGLSLKGGSAFLDECSVVESRAARGAGIHVNSAKVEAVLCDINNNEALSNGGGVQVEGRRATFNAMSCTIAGNEALRGGGLAAQDLADVYALNTEIFGNSADMGGGVYAHGRSGTRIFETCAIYENAANRSGGGIHIDYSATFELIGQSRVEHNSSAANGGGIYAHRANLLIRDSHCCFNNSAFFGGGLLAYLCTPTVETSVISNNTVFDVTGSIVNIGSSIGSGC